MNSLLFATKQDIPFMEGECILHNPSIEEIALIGEKEYHAAVELIVSVPKNIIEQGKVDSEDISDFDIILMIVNDTNYREYRTDILLLFSLLFVNCQFKIDKDNIKIIEENGLEHFINRENFESFQNLIVQMFKTDEEQKAIYRPADGLAKKIADKIKRGQEKREQKKGKDPEKANISIFKKYATILSVGEQKDINMLYQCTVKQLKEEFDMYQKKVAFDRYVEARMAGATDIETPDNWME